MTAEQFHDALSLLPMELVEEADRRRQNPGKKPVLWGRYAGLAACLILLLGCGWLVKGMFHAGAKSSEAILADEAAPQLRENVGTGSVDTAGPAEIPEAEGALEEGELGLSLLAVVEAPIPADSSVNYQSPPPVQVISRAEDVPVDIDLPEGWFDSHDMVVLFLAGYPEAPQSPDICRKEEVWLFTFPESDGTDGKDWYVLIEAEKGQITPEQIQIAYS